MPVASSSTPQAPEPRSPPLATPTNGSYRVSKPKSVSVIDTQKLARSLEAGKVFNDLESSSSATFTTEKSNQLHKGNSNGYSRATSNGSRGSVSSNSATYPLATSETNPSGTSIKEESLDDDDLFLPLNGIENGANGLSKTSKSTPKSCCAGRSATKSQSQVTLEPPKPAPGSCCSQKSSNIPTTQNWNTPTSQNGAASNNGISNTRNSPDLQIYNQIPSLESDGQFLQYSNSTFGSEFSLASNTTQSPNLPQSSQQPNGPVARQMSSTRLSEEDYLGTLCECGPDCSCFACPVHPYNQTTVHHVQDLRHILQEDSPQSPSGSAQEELISPLDLDGLNQGFFPNFSNSLQPGTSASHIQPSLDYLTPPSGSSGLNESFNRSNYFFYEFPIDQYGPQLASCADDTGACQCGPECACVGCLTHGRNQAPELNGQSAHSQQPIVEPMNFHANTYQPMHQRLPASHI
jgi:hypothetical protein